MLKVIMSGGEEYSIKKSEIPQSLNKHLYNSDELPNKLIKINDSLYINMSQISSVKDKEYIDDPYVIIP